MKAIRWTRHALEELSTRNIPRTEADQTLTSPDRISAGRPPRKVYQRRYYDSLLGCEMLLRIVVEESKLEIAVVTVYKTSKLHKYT